MSDLSAIIEVSADASGVEIGLAPAKKSISNFKASAIDAGNSAGGAFDKSGDGAKVAANKVESATKNIIGSIQRQIAITEAGAKSNAQYYRVLADQRGIDRTALQPYLDQLDAVKIKQIAATGALQGAAPALDKIGISAKQTAAALRGVPAQFTDIVVSLQGGQAPLTVLLQQGGQLKDMFGGVGNAARALGGYVAGLVNPFTLAAAAAAGLGYIIFKGQQEQAEYAKALILSGNAAGATAGQLQDYAKAIAQVSGTQGNAAEAVTAFAASGKIGAQNLEAFALAAVKFEKATGQAVAETVKQFVELGKSPVEASVKLTDQYGYLTLATYKEIKALEDQGRAVEAANLAQKTFADTLQSRTGQIVDNTGAIARGWNSVKSAVSGAVDAIMNIGRVTTPADTLAALKTQLTQRQERNQGLGIKDGKATEELRVQISYLEEQERMVRRSAVAAADRNQINALGIEFSKQGAEFETKAAKLQKETLKATVEGNQLVKAGLLTQVQLNERLSAIKDKYKEALKSGGAATGESEVAGLKARITQETAYLAQLKERGAQAEKLTFFEQASIKINEELKTTISGGARAQKEKALAVAQSGVAMEKETAALVKQISLIKKAEEETLKQAQAVDQSTKSYQLQAEDLNASNAVFGKGKTAIAEYRLEETKRLALMADSSENFSPAYVAALNNQVAAQERFVVALKASDYKDIANKQTEATRAIEAAAQAYQDEAALAGLTGVERAKVVALRKIELDLAKGIAEIDRTSLSESDKQSLRDTARNNAARAGQVETAKIIADEYVKTADIINQSLTDALLNSSQKGIGFFKSLANSIRDIFKKLVLEPTVKAAVGGITGALGLPGLAGAESGGGGLGGLSNLGSLASNGSSLLNIGSQVVGGTMSLANAAGTVFANAAGTGLSGFLGTNAAYGTAVAGAGAIGASAATAAVAGNVALAAGTAAALPAGTLAAAGLTSTGAAAAGAAGIGSTVTTALASIGPVGWAAIAVGAGLMLFGGKKEPAVVNTGNAGAAYNAKGEQVSFTENFGGTSGAVNKSISGMAAAYKAAALALGIDQVDTYFGTGGYKTPGKNDDKFKTIGGVTSGKFADQKFSSGVIAATPEAMSLAANRAVLAALVGSDLPRSLEGFFDGIDVNTIDKASIDKLLTYGQALKGVDTQLQSMPFENLKKLSYGAAQGLYAASGGLEKFQSNLATYFQNFYSAEEQRAQTIKDINAATAGSGLDAANATRESFKKLVNSQDLTAEAGQKTYASLVSVAGALSGLLPPLDAVGKKISDIMQSLLNERVGLEANLLDAKGDGAGASALRRQQAIAGFAEAEIAAYDYNQSIIAQTKTLQDAQQRAAAELAIATQRGQIELSILGLQGDAAGVLAIQRGAEIKALDASLIPLKLLEFGLQDMATAAAAAAAKANAAAATYFQGIDSAKNIDSLKGESVSALNKFFATTTSGANEALGAAQSAQAAAKSAAENWRSAAKSIESAIDAIRNKTAEVSGNAYTNLLAQFQTQTVLARGGDAGAAGQLSGIASSFLSASESQSETLVDYLRDRARVESSLVETLGQANTGATVQDTIAAATQATVSQLQAANVTLTGFSAEIFKLLEGGYKGADRSTAENASGIYAAMTDEFSRYFKNAKEGDTQAYAGGVYQRLGGDMAQFTSGAGKTDYFRSSDSLIDVAKRIPELREEWQTRYGIKLPAFAVGTNYVPRDMLAQIHEGEAIVPRAYNPAAGGGTGNTERLEALLEKLTAEVQDLKVLQGEGNTNTREAASAANGANRAPVIVQIMDKNGQLA